MGRAAARCGGSAAAARSRRRIATQIMIPRGATVLDEPPRHRARASGSRMTAADGVAMLPGVPREMRGMLADELLPRITRAPWRRTSRRRALAHAANDRHRGVDARRASRSASRAAVRRAVARVPARPGGRGPAPHRARTAAPTTRTRRCATRHRDAAQRASRVMHTPRARRTSPRSCSTLCRCAGLTIAVAESCTGGLLGARLTAIPGSSDVVLGGVIAYSNDVKQRLLGVRAETLASSMARSAKRWRRRWPPASGADSAPRSASPSPVSPGPGGGTPEKPVGLVWIAVDVDGRRRTHGSRFIGDRAEIRFRATQAALDLVRRMAGRLIRVCRIGRRAGHSALPLHIESATRHIFGCPRHATAKTFHRTSAACSMNDKKHEFRPVELGRRLSSQRPR